MLTRLQNFFWQSKLQPGDAFLWTVIVVVLSAYGIGVLWCLGYNPLVLALVPIAIQSLFGWHHWLRGQVTEYEATEAAAGGHILMPQLEEPEDVHDFDLSNVYFLQFAK
jgi:hypothetical protein